MISRSTRLAFVVAGIAAIAIGTVPGTSRGDSTFSDPHSSRGDARANPGVYSCEVDGPDWLTTLGKVKPTYAAANPVQSKLEGMVVWMKDKTSGGTVRFDGRLAGQGCIYDVEGDYLDPGEGKAKWYSSFDNRPVDAASQD